MNTNSEEQVHEIPSEIMEMYNLAKSAETKEQAEQETAQTIETAPIAETTEPKVENEKVAEATTEETKTTPEPTPNYEYLEEVFGEKLDKETAKAKLQELKEKIKQAETSAKEFQAPTLSEKAMKYDAFIKVTGIDDVGTYQKLLGTDLESTDPNNLIELLVMQKMVENKGMDSAEINDYREYMKHKYKVGADPDELSEQEIKFAQIELREAARPIKSQLSETISKFKDQSPINHREVYEKAKQSWQPEIEKWKNDETSKKITYQYNGDKKNGEEAFALEVPFEITGDVVELAMKEALEEMAKNDVEMTPQNIDIVKNNTINYAKQLALSKHFQSITDKAVSLAIEARDKHWVKQINQPSAQVVHATPQNVSNTKVDTAKMVDSIWEGK